MNEEQQLEYAAQVLRTIKAERPELDVGDLVAVLSLAALAAQGSYAVMRTVLKTGD